MKHGRSDSTALRLQEDMAATQRKREIVMDRLVEKWSKVDVGANLDQTYLRDKGRARRAAWAIQMQENHLRKLSETIISNSFQTTPENVLKIVRIGTANSNRGNYMHEYPLETTDDAIFYLEFTRELALRGASAGEKMYDIPRAYYRGEARTESIGTGNGATTTFSATLSNFPISQRSVKVIEGVAGNSGSLAFGALRGNDDGAGVLSGTNISSGTINYSTGAVSVTFTVAPVSGAAVLIEYNWDSEVASLDAQYAKVGLSIQKRRFDARPHPLGYYYTRMTELMLGTEGFGSAEDLLIQAVGDEHARAKDFRSINKGRSVALQNPVTTFDADYATAGEVSDKGHAQRLLSTIRKMGGDLFNELGRGVINNMLCAMDSLTYVQKHDLWKTDTSQPRVGGTYLAGYLDDIAVYGTMSGSGTGSPTLNTATDGLLANNEILALYRNPQEDGDMGIAWGVLTELADQLVYPQHRIEGNLSTVEDHIVFQSKYCRLLRIANITF